MADLQDYITAFSRLNVNRQGDHISPHKPCMLLALIELAEAGHLDENKIEFAPPLLERYRTIFDLVKDQTDHSNPYFPFFHLKREGFWYLEPKPGRSIVLEAIDSARSPSKIQENVAYAYVDPALHQLLLEPECRNELRAALVARWFPDKKTHLLSVLEANTQANQYEFALRHALAGEDTDLDTSTVPRSARDTAFRRIVTETYDYRCAASGWRIILPDEVFLVEAAHLIPFKDSFDDNPRNGIALTPTYHWALDRQVIAPGPDLKWHVSKILDPRIPDNQPLLDLEGKPIILPREQRYYPRRKSLEWRMGHLRRE